MKNIFLGAFISLGIVCGFFGVYWCGSQPKVTYYPSGVIKTSVERKFFKENGEGKLYDERGKTIQIYRVVDGVKNGPAKVIFGDGEVTFDYVNDKISGNIDIHADEDVKELNGLILNAFDETLKVKKKFGDGAYVKATTQISCNDDEFIPIVQKYFDNRSKENLMELAKCLDVDALKYDSDRFKCNMKGQFKYPDFEEKTVFSCEDTVADEKLNINVDGKKVVLSLKQAKGDGFFNISGNVATDYQNFFSSLIDLYEKATDDKVDYETVAEVAGNLEINSAKINVPDDINCSYEGSFLYPDFKKKTTLSCKVTDYGDSYDVSLKVRDKSFILNFAQDSNLLEISGKLVGDNKAVFDTIADTVDKYDDDEIDYDAFAKMASSIEINGIKINVPDNDLKCTYEGSFVYPDFTKDMQLTCNVKNISNSFTDAIANYYTTSSEDMSDIGYIFPWVDAKDIKIGLQYTVKDDVLTYLYEADDKLSSKYSHKGLKKLLPLFVKYAFSDFGKKETVKIIAEFLKNYTITDSEIKMNGKLVSKLDGSFNFLNGFSGKSVTNSYVNNTLVINTTVQGGNITIKVNRPLSGKVLAGLNIKFKDNLKGKYQAIVKKLLQNISASGYDSASMEANMENLKYDFIDLINSLDSVSGTLVDEKGFKVVSVVAKIKSGVIVKDENSLTPDIVDAKVYIYKDNKTSKVLNLREDGFYDNGKRVSDEEMEELMQVKEKITIMFEDLSKEYEQVFEQMKQNKVTLSFAPFTGGVLSVGFIAGYTKAMSKYRINKTVDQITMVVINIRTLYAAQASYEGLSTSNMHLMGITPDEMGKDGTLTNPFGGKVEITLSDSGVEEKTNDAFIISNAGLPLEACVNIATQDWGSPYSSGFLGIGVNESPDACKVNTGVKRDAVKCGTRMSVYDAANLCTTGDNTIYLKYY